MHEAVCQEHGYALVDVHGGPAAERREFVQWVVSRQLAERAGSAWPPICESLRVARAPYAGLVPQPDRCWNGSGGRPQLRLEK